MISSLTGFLWLAVAYLKFNLRAQLAYRGAFISQVVAMFLNDIVWVTFWWLFFTRFPVLRGWDVKDVITVWAIAAAGFGISHGICGNAFSLSSLIVQGQLDVWMLYPRALLPHLLLGRTNATAWGDALFGYVIYLAIVRPDPVHFLLFFLLSISAAMVFLGFNILVGSLAFFLGNSEGLAEQLRFSLITFSTYPSVIFEGPVKVILFTAIPAMFINNLPITALRELSLFHAALSFLGGVLAVGIGGSVFYYGLRRYESGNLMNMRG